VLLFGWTCRTVGDGTGIPPAAPRCFIDMICIRDYPMLMPFGVDADGDLAAPYLVGWLGDRAGEPEYECAGLPQNRGRYLPASELKRTIVEPDVADVVLAIAPCSVHRADPEPVHPLA
jgi:hypothetical protein